MSALLRAFYINRALTATLTATPAAAATGAVTFLQSDDRGDKMIAAASGTQDLYLTWGGTSYSDTNWVLLINRANFAYNDTIRIRTYSTTDWTGGTLADSTALAAYTSGLFDNWGWSFYKYYFACGAAVKSVRITLSTASAFSASQLFLGPYTQALINPAYGFTVSPMTNSTQERSEAGSLDSLIKADWREAAFDMMFMTEAERKVWLEIARYCGVARPIGIDLFPDDTAESGRDHFLYGKFAQPPAMKLSDVTRYDQSVRVLEM